MVPCTESPNNKRAQKQARRISRSGESAGTEGSCQRGLGFSVCFLKAESTDPFLTHPPCAGPPHAPTHPPPNQRCHPGGQIRYVHFLGRFLLALSSTFLKAILNLQSQMALGFIFLTYCLLTLGRILHFNHFMALDTLLLLKDPLGLLCSLKAFSVCPLHQHLLLGIQKSYSFPKYSGHGSS